MLTEKIVLVNKLGLHARAASKLVQCCNSFGSQIEVSFQNKKVDATSIMSVMLLAAPCGSELEFSIDGHDADEAWTAVEKLINDRFGEEQ